MTTWWPLIGETSLMAGSTLGFAWAVSSTSRRRGKFLEVGVRPQGQVRWFLLSLVSMSCYLTLVAALGLASLNNLLPPTLFWYLLGMGSLAFTSALLFPAVEVSHPVSSELKSSQEPPASPPLLPLRRSA
jgi:hypothetical protein